MASGFLYPIDMRTSAPIIQQIADELERRKNQSQQTPPTTAEIIDGMVIQGAQNAASPQQPQQPQQGAQPQQGVQPQQAPQPQQGVQPQQGTVAPLPPPAIYQRPKLDPVQADMINQILDYKKTYADSDLLARAQNPTVTDNDRLTEIANKIRADAHEGAEDVRRLATENGIDLSSYSADTTLKDARHNLDTRRVHEIVDMMSPEGEFARTSDKYFDDEFLSAVAHGKSAREAKRFAARRTRDYQANRLYYLRNLYNTYGRDGNYTNNVGVSLLEMIAQENPEVAKVYAAAYKLPTHKQDKLDKFEEMAQTYLYDIGKIEKKGDEDRKSIREQGKENRTTISHQGEVTKDVHAHQHGLNMEEIAFQGLVNDNSTRLRADLDLRNGKTLAQFTHDLKQVEPDEVDKMIAAVRKVSIMNGATEEEADAYAAQYALDYQFAKLYGVKGIGGKNDGESQPKLSEKKTDFMNNMANLFYQAKADPQDMSAIEKMEELFQGGATPDGVKASDFSVGEFQMWKDQINALKGMYYKARGDDNRATLYWSQVRDVQVLEKMYPDYNWDWYWDRRGGKPR